MFPFVNVEEVQVRPIACSLLDEEEPIEILARELKELRKKRIPLVKVLWRNHKTDEAMWESEKVMQQQYPQMFNEGNFDDEILLRMGEL